MPPRFTETHFPGKVQEATEKAGLVHNTNNWIESTGFICNCCGCCCGFLKMIKEYESSAWLEFSNFKVQAEPEECVGCGDCIDRCQMNALTLEGERILVKATTSVSRAEFGMDTLSSVVDDKVQLCMSVEARKFAGKV